jgi:hypothetical protein
LASATSGFRSAKLDIALAAMEEALGSRTAACTLRDRFLSHLCDEDTLSYSVLFTVCGRAPEHGVAAHDPIARPIDTK